jgi:hypothetical protein
MSTVPPHLTVVPYFHVAPKFWVPHDHPESVFSLQWVLGGSGSENPEYQG